MRNYSKVYLMAHRRNEFDVTSITEMIKNETVNHFITNIYYIPADARMDGI